MSKIFMMIILIFLIILDIYEILRILYKRRTKIIK